MLCGALSLQMPPRPPDCPLDDVSISAGLLADLLADCRSVEYNFVMLVPEPVAKSESSHSCLRCWLRIQPLPA